MNKYIKVYDKENHERKFIERVSGIDVIVSKDIIIDRYEKELQQKENIIKELKEDITFCINNMKNEYSCTDSRTNRELHTMVKILEESLDKGE